MKKAIILTAFTSIMLIASGQSPEEENIKKVVRMETESYFNKDLEAWSSTWKQDAKLSRIFISNYGYSALVGWDSAKALMENYFSHSSEPRQAQINTENYTIRTVGDMAWVDFHQVLTLANDTADYPSHEFRLLVKENDQWKIATQISTFPESFNSDKPEAIENDLNTTGYKLLNTKKLNDAIEVFKLNVKLFPNAWNTYDSLGEAYALAGNKKLAIENYEKSIKLNPKSESGPTALAKLKEKK